MELDRIIHEPVRLRIMAMLGGVDTADFKFMISALRLSKGNLSSPRREAGDGRSRESRQKLQQ
jgi:hypothetical protein